MSEIGGVWRTIGGRRVFIKDGQDLASAMKESGKFHKIKEEENIKELRKKLENAKGFLERARIQNEITALEKGYNNYEEYEKDKMKKVFKTAYLKDSKGNEYKINEEELRIFVANRNVNISDWQNCDSKLQEEYSKQIGYSSPMQKISMPCFCRSRCRFRWSSSQRSDR